MAASLLVHCDWSIAPQKRWMCFATPSGRGYFISYPELVGPLELFFDRLRNRTPTGAILVGVDFPIGLPRAYAYQAKLTNFKEALLLFDAEFYTPALRPDEISLKRPFYPLKPGGTRKSHLVYGLKLQSAKELLRRCDVATAQRNAACELFWTLGAKQVGRAAISGWQNLLAPAIAQGSVVLWPFDGELDQLMLYDDIVVAESYPAETYSHIGLARGFGKGRQAGRQSQASQILHWCELHSVQLDVVLESDVRDGFGKHRNADDIFDSVIGVLGLVEVLQNPPEFPTPLDPAVQLIEGWILGLKS